MKKKKCDLIKNHTANIRINVFNINTKYKKN